MKLEKLENKAQRATQKVEKAREKLPKKKRVRRIRTFDEESGKAKKKWAVTKEEQLAKRRLLKKGARAVTTSAAIKVHGKISQVEKENAAVEATHATEQKVESTIRFVNHHKRTKLHKRSKKVKKLEKRELKANTKYQYKKFLEENPQYQKQFFKKRMQKKRIQKEFAKKIRSRYAKGVETVVSKLSDIFKKKKGAIVGLSILGMLIFMIIASFASCATMFMGGGTDTIACSYASEPSEINKVEDKYTELELNLQNTIDKVETDHPGYDEYRYNVGAIGHNPFALVNYFSAKNEIFTYQAVNSQISEVFEEMYQLSFRSVQETRTRTEQRTGQRTIRHLDGTITQETYQYDVEVEYTVKILETTLTVKGIEQIAEVNLTDEQKLFYEAYGVTHGGLQQFASPLDLYWYNYVSSYHGYRKNPNTGAEEYHDGIDIAVPEGNIVYAAMDSVVSEIGEDSYYGKYLCLSDSRGFVIKYAHLSEITVSDGESVAKGTEIGKTGHSGTCNQPHLHLQLSYNGSSYNPIFYFNAESATLYGEDPAGVQPNVTPPAQYDEEAVRKLMEEAAKHVGKPYVWGGSNPVTGFDCSGYVCWVITQSGFKNLPRTTAQGIYNQCTPISKSEAKAGDLIFFTRTYNSGTAVTHVGIYCGENIMVHCGDPIKYSNISSPYWSSHFYGFGRLN